MLENQTITAIVPAYNEEPRLSKVLKVLKSVQFIDEILVIDDGSRDKTAQVSLNMTVDVLRHNRNRGKGAALVSGIRKKSESDVYLFLDADLIHLNEKHLYDLVKPIVSDSSVVMTIGVFKGGRGSTDLAQKVCPILNGQRAVRGTWVRSVKDFSWSRFGVEVFLTHFARDFGGQVEMVPLWGISHYHKEEKYGPILGFYHRMKMYIEIIYAYLLYESKIKMKDTVVSDKSSEKKDEKYARV
ncbi:MAG: glycosyltransferase family 2 protein [Candidatus Atribacteria bacterium]|nr:glycosyltransferase family 2 protein [Candidatus Atribacteria bacterium]